MNAARARLWLSVVTALTALAALAGCRREEPHAGEQELVVYAASSLQPVFTALEGSFRATHPGLDLTLHFAGSQELRTQLEQGASADVIATADTTLMAALVTAGRAQSPVTFARNEPVIVVPATSTLQTFSDLPNAARIVIGAPAVPIGRYSRALLGKANGSLGADFSARVEARVVSNELNVRQVLMKVRFGEADAGIVYRSDVLDADGVRAIAIPADINVIAEYPIAAVVGSHEPSLAAEFIALVTSTAGRDALRAAGFRPMEDVNKAMP